MGDQSRIILEMAKTILALEKRITALEVKPRKTATVSGEYARMVEIVGEVARGHGISIAGLMGRNHGPMYAWPRQEAMTLCNEAGFTKVQVGAFFDRDHSTVLNAVRVHRKRQSERTAAK